MRRQLPAIDYAACLPCRYFDIIHAITLITLLLLPFSDAMLSIDAAAAARYA